MHEVSEMRVLVARGRRVILLRVRERSRRLLVHEDFKERAATFRADKGFHLVWTDDLLPLPSTWEYLAGLPLKASIPGFWDSAVPVICGTGADIVYSSPPQCGLEEPVSVLRCYI